MNRTGTDAQPFRLPLAFHRADGLTDSATEEELGAVIFGNHREVVQAGAGEILLGLNVLEHFADSERLPLAGEC